MSPPAADPSSAESTGMATLTAQFTRKSGLRHAERARGDNGSPPRPFTDRTIGVSFMRGWLAGQARSAIERPIHYRTDHRSVALEISHRLNHGFGFAVVRGFTVDPLRPEASAEVP